VILEPLQDFDNEMWAATPYDTITLGPHQLGAKTFILANGDTLAGDIRKRITDNAGVTVEAFTGTGARATRDTVDRKLATIAGLSRLVLVGGKSGLTICQRYHSSRKALAQRALIALTQLDEVRNGPFQEQCRKFGGDANIPDCAFLSSFP
jgi:hypothetical protein